MLLGGNSQEWLMNHHHPHAHFAELVLEKNLGRLDKPWFPVIVPLNQPNECNMVMGSKPWHSGYPKVAGSRLIDVYSPKYVMIDAQPYVWPAFLGQDVASPILVDQI